MGWLENKTKGVPNVAILILAVFAGCGTLVVVGAVLPDEKEKPQTEIVDASANDVVGVNAMSAMPSATSATTSTTRATGDANFPVTVGCTQAAKDTIARMQECGLNADGFATNEMCRKLGYQKLSVLRAMTCDTLTDVIQAGMK